VFSRFPQPTAYRCVRVIRNRKTKQVNLTIGFECAFSIDLDEGMQVDTTQLHLHLHWAGEELILSTVRDNYLGFCQGSPVTVTWRKAGAAIWGVTRLPDDTRHGLHAECCLKLAGDVVEANIHVFAESPVDCERRLETNFLRREEKTLLGSGNSSMVFKARTTIQRGLVPPEGFVAVKELRFVQAFKAAAKELRPYLGTHLDNILVLLDFFFDKHNVGAWSLSTATETI